MPEHSTIVPRVAAIAGVMATLVCFAWMSGWVGEGNTAISAEAFHTLLTSLPLPLMWLAASAGLGWPLRRWFAGTSTHPIAAQIALGIAAMLMLDAALGSIGVLTNRNLAYAIIAAGIALLLIQLTRHRNTSIDQLLPHSLAWMAAPAAAVLLIAACAAPGWLWSTEFGGYDALSYHLQLPKEWLARGAIEPLDHNIYSFLPGFMEAAYLHLMSMRGDAMHALDDCQMLHAVLAVVGAAMIGTLASRWTGHAMGAFAAALYLATPWTVVVGSLAYNEMTVNIMLAAGLLMAFDDHLPAWRRGILIGFLSAAACGSKLTALGFVAAPLAVVLLALLPLRLFLPALALALIAGTIGLAPYFIRNALHSGNPVFPFATELFGHAHWTLEQVLAWNRGHMPDEPLAQRFTALWRQLFIFGFGSNPRPGEPWLAQWSVLPWLGVIGGMMATLRMTYRREAAVLMLVLLAQVLFWIAFTHLQSRFLLPCAVPLCVLTSLGIRSLQANTLLPKTQDSRLKAEDSRALLIAMHVALLVMVLLPIRIYSQEAGGAPSLAIGTALQQTGDALPDDEARHDLGSTALPAVAINWLLPPDTRVLFIGESTPLYYKLDRISYVTVWDRTSFSRVLRHEPAFDPDAICNSLRSLGYTHVLVNPTMLAIWQRSRWNDPLITQRSVQHIFETAAEPIFDYPRPRNITIYSLAE